MKNDWELLSKILALIVAAGAAWVVVKQWVIPNFRSFVFAVLRDPEEGLPVLNKIVTEAFAERVRKTDGHFLVVDDLSGRMDAAELGIKTLSLQLGEVKTLADGVPELTRVLREIRDANQTFADKFERGMREFGEHIADVRESVARMEGKWDGVNRRDK